MARILVVEDDARLARILESELWADGYAVEAVSDGNSALKYAQSKKFDLVLLDVGLPEKDGFTECRELRARHPHTPIIMLTGRSTEADTVMGLDLGADEYVTKPFSNHALRARIRALLRRTKRAEIDSYPFGAVEVDFARGEVRVDGQAVPVTQTEYKLLYYFIEKRGKVLPREKILTDVWHRAVGDRVVDTCVWHLRSKLEPNPEAPVYFVKVRGLGYRFERDKAV